MKSSSTAFRTGRKSITIFASLLLTASGIIPIYGQERLGRPMIPGATVARGTGTQTVPAGTVLKIAINTALTSKTAEVGDRFRGSTIAPVIGSSGRTLIPTGSIIEGSVSAVTPAKRARKSGKLSLTFERIRFPNGRTYVLRGILRDFGGRDKKRVDDEGDLKGNGTKKESGMIVGGGAGSGALIGAAAGGAAAGLGIGAAAGVGIALLRKGKEAEVRPGQRFGLELGQSIRIGATATSANTGVPYILRPRPRVNYPAKYPSTPTYPRTRPPVYAPTSYVNGSGGQGTLNVIDADANRMSDGYVRIRISAEIQNNRRIYTHYQVTGSTVNVRLYGGPAPNTGNAYVSSQPAPIINIEDKNRRLRTINIYGRGGIRYLEVDGRLSDATYRDPVSVAKYTPTRARPTQPRPATRPTTPVASSKSPRQMLNDITSLREEFAYSVGLELNRDGTINNKARSEASLEQRRIVYDLNAMHKSFGSFSASANATNANKVKSNTESLKQTWQVVKMDPELNQRFLQLFTNSRSLTSRYQGASRPPRYEERQNESSRNNDDDDNQVIADVPVTTNNLTKQASDTRVKIIKFFHDYAGRLGIWVEDDGTFDNLGTRRLTQKEENFLQNLSGLLNMAKRLESSTGATNRLDLATRLRQQADKVEDQWPDVRISNDFNPQFNTMIQSSKLLAQQASR